MAVVRSRLWRGWLLVGAVLTTLYFVESGGTGKGMAADLIYAAISASTAVAIGAAVRLHRPDRPLVWILLAVAQLSYAVGDTSYVICDDILHKTGYPGIPDVFYLLQFPFMICAIAVVIRRRTPGWHTSSWIDAAVLGTASGLVWWIYVIAPLTSGAGLGALALAVTVAYPVLDLLVLATALRLVLDGGAHPRSFWLLIGSLLAMLIGDTIYTLDLSWSGGGWVNGLWLGSYVLGAASALHPSMRTLTTQAHTQAPKATGGRVAILVAASTLAPIVLLVQYLRGNTTHVPVIALACIVLFLLVLARMMGLVSTQRLSATMDGLTQLRNRAYFNEALRTEAARAARTGRNLGVVMVDADHFKRINDTYGHLAGDDVLVELADRLLRSSRPVDTVARYGGEEFAVLLPGAGSDEALAVAERIRANIAGRPMLIGTEEGLAVTVSVGVASGQGDDPQGLVSAADQALYEAKRSGRNRVAGANATSGPAAMAATRPESESNLFAIH